ncbi:hypothetical protein ROSMUCSMR3_02921 [Roseovarius mucosus]|uniref:Uncharacterized protein n=1 Tax=Roseovarius mucosus TaxID=215743 RepID=A0A1V0RRI4_9RHOB|nr:hypothetical protein [Roseovarius mucosus]ARE84388.1 hypothetical protein ROSMUCSMR3_02921 [Roseovarius mucosus]
MKTFTVTHTQDLGETLPALLRNISVLKDFFGYEKFLVNDVEITEEVLSLFSSLTAHVTEKRKHSYPTCFIVDRLMGDYYHYSEISEAWNIPITTFYRIKKGELT